LRNGGGVFATALRHFGLAARAPTELRRDLAEELARLHLADEILRHHRDELDLRTAGAHQHDDARAELVA
jgi:hypothetical protein